MYIPIFVDLLSPKLNKQKVWRFLLDPLEQKLWLRGKQDKYKLSWWLSYDLQIATSPLQLCDALIPKPAGLVRVFFLMSDNLT